MSDSDDAFFNRVDSLVDFANNQVSSNADQGDISSSFMYALSRYNAYVSATSFKNKADMKNNKKDIIKYFVDEYKKDLEENIDDYIANFNEYMNIQRPLHESDNE